MVTWMLTTGSSDVQLKNKDNFDDLSLKIYEQLYDCVFTPQPLENKDYWTVPARALGLAYNLHLENYYEDLHFPLLDSFCQRLQEENIIPDKIYLIITDQANIFAETDRYLVNCPYWKDSVTLQPIFKKYLNEKFAQAQLYTLILEPFEKSKGLDHWDSCLTLVQNELSKLDLEKEKVIYISHQAGTPAISSALQFASLAAFGNKVQFLLGNEYQNENIEVLESSKYLRGIQIQQAKSLIQSSPGSAQKLLNEIYDIKLETKEKLKYYVNIFNLNKTPGEKNNELTIEAGTQRIVDALDLISIFLNQENYLQAITLLSAAQETFLKVAILNKTASDLEWTREGLFINRKYQNKSPEQKNCILKQLRYPIEELGVNSEIQFKKTNNNSIMLKWLKTLEPKFNSWAILEWYCKYNRKRDDDLRNQLMHNLCGIERVDILHYLIGYKLELLPDRIKNIVSESDKIENSHIIEVYNNKVKTPFFTGIQILELPCIREKLPQKLKNLAESLQ